MIIGRVSNKLGLTNKRFVTDYFGTDDINQGNFAVSIIFLSNSVKIAEIYRKIEALIDRQICNSFNNPAISSIVTIYYYLIKYLNKNEYIIAIDDMAGLLNELHGIGILKNNIYT